MINSESHSMLLKFIMKRLPVVAMKDIQHSPVTHYFSTISTKCCHSTATSVLSSTARYPMI